MSNHESKIVFKNKLKLSAALLVTGSCSVYSLPAYAQVDEIVVTARKTAENLQDVPVSVTAFTGEFFEDSGLVQFSDISRLTPNFDVQEDGVQGAVFATLTIRGQTALNEGLNSDQAVGIVINGAPVTRGTNLFSNMFDVEQIEVLKGPQGTLFGKNTTGGTVIIRTTAPQLGELSGYVESDIGNLGRVDLEGVLNLPIGDTFALRLGAAKQERDGYAFGKRRTGLADTVGTETGTEFGNDDEYFLRASALYEPNDALSIRLNADYHEVDETGSPIAVLNDGPFDVFGNGSFILPIALRTIDDSFYAASNQRDYAPRLIADEYNLNGTVTYDFGGVTLESVTSYRDQFAESDTPFAAAADVLNGQESNIFAQEFRLSGNTGALKWQTGVFYAKEEGIDLDDVANSQKLTEAENKTQAIFAQGTYSVSDRLNFTAGLRYTDETRSLAQTGHTTEALVPAIEASFDGLSWTLNADYKLTDEVLTYASVSRGFRSGAIDDEAIDSTVTNNVAIEDILIDPEFVTTYEAGLKGDFFNNVVRWNSAIWYSDYKDIQVEGFDPEAVDAGGNAIITINNAADAKLWGIESELQFVPNDNLSMGAAVGYTNAEFGEFLDEDPVTNIVRDRSDEAIGGPEWQFSAFGRYDFEISDVLDAGVQLNYSYRGKEELLGGDEVAFFADPSQVFLDSYGILNGQFDLDFNTNGVTMAIYGRNLLDNEYYSSGFALTAFGLDLAQRIQGTPREYGVRIRKSF